MARAVRATASPLFPHPARFGVAVGPGGRLWLNMTDAEAEEFGGGRGPAGAGTDSQTAEDPAPLIWRATPFTAGADADRVIRFRDGTTDTVASLAWRCARYRSWRVRGKSPPEARALALA